VDFNIGLLLLVVPVLFLRVVTIGHFFVMWEGANNVTTTS
jgi:hypothetical protein